jgi:outer membrane biosynthesis protein TonB
MKSMSASLALALALLAPAAMAETLLVERVQAEAAVAMPTRGSTMSQVQARFGAPTQKMAPVAGPNDRKHNPPITRWLYPTFEVYFEYDHVIDSVLIKASPEEIGPAPVRQ